MHLSDLQLKEIVNISNGKRIGNIIDVIVNDKGTITKLIVEERSSKKLFSSTKDDSTIMWNQIIKIGDDIIIVDLNKNL